MEMGFDHDAWPLGQDPGAESGVAQGGFDWHGLRARFLAALACRDVLGEADGPAGSAVSASFDRAAARSLATYEHGPHGVNPNALADGKAHLGNGEDVAGATMPGD